MELKEILLSLRREKGLSQAELAEELGVSRQAVSRWEAGLAVPSGENLIALSRVYGVTVEEMLRNGRGEEKEWEILPPESGDMRKRYWPQKNIILLLLIAVFYLSVYIWGVLTNSKTMAYACLGFATTFIILAWVLHRFYVAIQNLNRR